MGKESIRVLIKEWEDLRDSLSLSIHPLDILECKVITRCIKELEERL
jgi:hypothetical protein